MKQSTIKTALFNGEVIEKNAWSISIDENDDVLIFPPTGSGFKTSLANVDTAIADFCKKSGMPLPGVNKRDIPKTTSDPTLGPDSSTKEPFKTPSINKADKPKGKKSPTNLGPDTSSKEPFKTPSVNKRDVILNGRGGLPDKDIDKGVVMGEPNWGEKVVKVKSDGRVGGRKVRRQANRIVDSFSIEKTPSFYKKHQAPSAQLLENIMDPEMWAANNRSVFAQDSHMPGDIDNPHRQTRSTPALHGYDDEVYDDFADPTACSDRKKKNKGAKKRKAKGFKPTDKTEHKPVVSDPKVSDEAADSDRKSDLDEATNYIHRDKKSRSKQAGPKLREKWDDVGAYNRDLEAESAEELYHLVRSFGSEDAYDWSGFKPNMPMAPEGTEEGNYAADGKFEGEGLTGTTVAQVTTTEEYNKGRESELESVASELIDEYYLDGIDDLHKFIDAMDALKAQYKVSVSETLYTEESIAAGDSESTDLISGPELMSGFDVIQTLESNYTYDHIDEGLFSTTYTDFKTGIETVTDTVISTSDGARISDDMTNLFEGAISNKLGWDVDDLEAAASNPLVDRFKELTGKPVEDPNQLSLFEASRKKAVDDEAESYWSDYYGDYGKQLVKDKTKDRKKDKEDKKEDGPAKRASRRKARTATRARIKANIARREAQQAQNPAVQPAEQNSMQMAQPADTGVPGAPSAAPAKDPAAPAAKPKGDATDMPPGSGDSGLQALGWTPEDIQVMSPEDKQNILKIRLNKPGTKPQDAKPSATPKDPNAPAPEKAPAAPGAPAAQPAAPAPAAQPTQMQARLMARRLEQKLKLRKAQQALQEDAPVNEPAPVNAPVTEPAKPTAPEMDTESTTTDEAAVDILQEVRAQQVSATDPIGVTLQKTKILTQRLLSELGLSLDDAKKIYNVKDVNKLFQ